MARIYHTKFFRIGVNALFKKETGATRGPFFKISSRRYVDNDGTLTRISDISTREQQYPSLKP